MLKFKNLYFLLSILAALLVSCEEEATKMKRMTEADSMVNAAYQRHDYNQLLSLTEELDSTGTLSEMKVNYWRGYAYSRQRKMRLAENYWKKATELDINSEEDLEYYAKSANRLAATLLLKDEEEATLRVAFEAVNKMNEGGYTNNDDFAHLLISIGCCQLRLGKPEEAKESFEQASLTCLKLMKEQNEPSDITSAIAGIISITDNYLMLKYFEESDHWTNIFQEFLQKYEQLPSASAEYLDKQHARLYLYKACALEGLGRQKEAAEYYDKAMHTSYAKTSDGLMEAINYLMSAKRWGEAADNYEMLDAQMQKYAIGTTLDNIPRYMLPKLRANINAHRNDSALTLAMQLSDLLDSAIVNKQQDDALELAIIYDTQQKETELAQQKEKMQKARFINAIIAMLVIVVVFAIIFYNRQRAARRLKLANQQLESANQKLEIANARAEESSKMKTEFIQQISHEIRTPLNILSGFTQIITTPDMELDNATKTEINEKIAENTERITGLVNKMLELSDASSQTVIERADSVPAIQIAAQAAEDSGISMLQQPQFDLRIAEEAETAMLTTNLQQATRALTLLLDNAQKYTKEGRICLSVKQDEGKILFIVEDTGIGIPVEEAEHIFEEFVQLNNNNEGTGIGLTVARSICRRLEGDVILDTSYTGGARFVMTLPV